MTETVVNLPAAAPARREIQNVMDPIPVLDTARFEHMQRIAAVMARSTMIPETLRAIGPKDKRVDLPYEQVLSNCFLVVNQATRWGFDPFAVISCCAVVHGRLSYEGKLVAAVLDAKLGVKLHHHFTGDPATDAYRIYLSDHPFTPEVIGQLKPGITIQGLRLWDGSVGEWKTAGAGTPWTPKNHKRMLIYRGSRDWTRIYEPAILLGVYTDDELEDLVEDVRARRATPVLTLTERLAAAKQPERAEGFSHEHVVRETATETEVQREAAGTDNSPPSPAPMASAQESVSTDSGEVQDRSESTSPPNSDSDAAGDAPLSDAPAAAPPDHQPQAAGKPSPESSATPADDADGGDATSPPPAQSPPSNLPEGTLILYAAGLRRAQKKDSLQKLAKAFWDERGGWEKWKTSADGQVAVAIFDAFKNNFGDKDAIDRDLRELF